MLISIWILEDGYKLPKRKKYVMTWTNSAGISSKCRLVAIMKQGPNLVYFARKQCLALGSQLRAKFKIIYRVRLLPSGEIQFIHPKDGVFRKSERRKEAVGNVNRLGKIKSTSIKFTGTNL
jgi:photosystem I subunit 2